MTRFLITLDEAVSTVVHAFKEMQGSEIFVRKIPSVNILDLAKVIAPNCKIEKIGMRPGEKLHEQLISSDESTYTYEYSNYYKILSPLNNWDSSKKLIKDGKKVDEGFTYNSNENNAWLKNIKLANWLNKIEYD